MSDHQSAESIFVATALQSWKVWIDRTSKLFDSLSDDEMFVAIAPGKNRPIYLLGHLIAVNGAMIQQLRLGEAAFPELWKPFVTLPDRALTGIPTTQELRQNWKGLNGRLFEYFEQLSPAQWLERHSTISEEDFLKEPHRNRLAILLSRTSHVSYHLGQLLLRVKP
jgi:hypothetical protein